MFTLRMEITTCKLWKTSWAE